eukprot:gene5085-8772_t
MQRWIFLGVAILAVVGASAAWTVEESQPIFIKDPKPANGTRKPLPEYVLDLSADPKDRWTHIVKPYKAELIRLINYVKSLVPGFLFDIVVALLGDLNDKLGQPWADEMRGIAEAIDVELGDIVFTNFFYEFDTACTSIVAQTSNGTIFHGRNLDYGLPDLQSIAVEVAFQHGNGSVLYRATTYAGYIGTLTGMRPGGFSVSIDERWTNASKWDNLVDFVKGYMPIGFALRTALEKEDNFEDAVNYLSNVKLITVSYLIVGGVSGDEGAVITRERESAVDVWRLAYPKRWFLVETNYDHWKPVPSSDDRRNPTIKHISQTSPSYFNSSTMWDIMNMFPTLNSETTYTAVMSASSGHAFSHIHICFIETTAALPMLRISTMDAVVDDIIQLYEDNEKRLYSDHPKDKENDAKRGYEDLNLAVGFVEHVDAHPTILFMVENNSLMHLHSYFLALQRDDETVVAALLHDIGWLQPKPSDASLLTSSDHAVWLAKHDVVGAKVLRDIGFSDRLSRLVEGHVQAKRYLTYKEEGYYSTLSEGSKFTLKHQGGIMSTEEAESFEKDPDFNLYCQIRRYDERAKVKGLDVPDVKSYKNLMIRCLKSALWTDRRGYSASDIVSASMKRFFDDQGYIVIRNWMTKAERAILPEYAAEIAAMPAGSAPPGPFHTYEKTAAGDQVLSRTECFMRAPDKNGMGTFLTSGRLKKICEGLRGSREQTLLKDKINYKLAGAGGYIAHQDGYWQILPDGFDEEAFKAENTPKRSKYDDVTLQRKRLMRDEEVCVCMIAVDASDASNGAPSVAPKWNQRGWLGLNAKDPELDKGLPIDAQVSDSDLEWKMEELNEGDVLIYGNLMPHKSAANTSDKHRRALFAIYGDVESLGNYEPVNCFCPTVKNPVDLRPDIRERYYAYEAKNRRANGSAKGNGRANRYFEGTPVLIQADNQYQ